MLKSILPPILHPLVILGARRALGPADSPSRAGYLQPRGVSLTGTNPPPRHRVELGHVWVCGECRPDVSADSELDDTVLFMDVHALVTAHPFTLSCHPDVVNLLGCYGVEVDVL